MRFGRRSVIGGGFALALSYPFAAKALRSPRPLKILVLGGTNFVGPHLVETALSRGHEVTLFNRGRTNPQLFPTVEKLRGNRLPELESGLSALQGNRKWDVAIDTWQGPPRAVKATTELLAGRVEAYGYVSSIAVYRNFLYEHMTPGARLKDVPSDADLLTDDLGYSLNKLGAEVFVARNFGAQGHRYRCTSIGGFDYSGNIENQASYWLLRFLLGGKIAVPADDAPSQWIDVKDVASFILTNLEGGAGRAYNLVGPAEPVTFLGNIAKISRIVDSGHEIIPIAHSILEAHGMQSFENLKNYIRYDDREPGFYQMSNKRAIKAGLTFRPYERTAEDFYRSYDFSGLSRENLVAIPADVERAMIAEALASS